MSVGQFVSFSTYMVQLTWPIIALGWVINLFQRGTASLIRINEIMQEQPEIKDAPEARKTREIKGEIEFRGLNFSYDGKAGSARPEPAHSRRQQPGDCRPHRIGQDDAGQPDPAHL